MVLHQENNQLKYTELFRGGEVSAEFLLRASSHMQTAVLPPQDMVEPLVSRPRRELDLIEIDTEGFGRIRLNEFLASKAFGTRGFLVIHKGTIVYEKYTEIGPEDLHLWMSCAKPTAGLLVEILISEGVIADNETIKTYIEDFKDTDWGAVSVRNILNMCSGLDLEDTVRSRFEPEKIPSRLYQSVFNLKNPGISKVETIRDVLRSANRKRNPGEVFEYASALTQMLVLLAEEVKGKPWHELFETYVWSKVKAEGELQLHLSPDGVAAPFGLISSNLRDMARFGMLYTPSWNAVSTEQVVTEEILRRIRDSWSLKEYPMNAMGDSRFADYLGVNDFIGNSRQWDVLWPDGDFWKSGLMSQGLYVSPDKDLVIAYFGVNNKDHTVHRFVRPIANSGLFDHSV